MENGREDAMRGREETRTRRAAQHGNIEFSVRTFDPSVRETFIWRFISAIRMDDDGEKDSSL